MLRYNGRVKEKEHLAFLDTVPEQFTIPHYITILDLEKKAESK